MKKIAQILILVLLFGLWGTIWYEGSRPLCEKGVVYSLGAVDAEFGISRDNFGLVVAEAADIWNQEIGREVIRFSEKGGLGVSLIYDERQEQTKKRQQL